MSDFDSKETEAEKPQNLPAPEARPVRTGEFVSRTIADETILVPIKSTFGELDDIFTLNEVAASTWELIDGQRTVAEIATAIASEFDVKPGQALTDTRELIAMFSEAELAAFAAKAA